MVIDMEQADMEETMQQIRGITVTTTVTVRMATTMDTDVS